jgi:hypothetical protein
MMPYGWPSLGISNARIFDKPNVVIALPAAIPRMLREWLSVGQIEWIGIGKPKMIPH